MSEGQSKGIWWTALLASTSALLVVGQVGTADAQFWQSLQFRSAPQYRPMPQLRQDNRSRPDTNARQSNSRNTAKSKKDTPIQHPFGENMPKGPLQLMVSVGDQRAVLYSNGVRVAETKISTGVPQNPTPTGIFSIIQKNRWHRSNIYSNAPMYFMHRLTWSGIALHEGHLPGYAASHGCIRMPTDFVSRLWNVSRLGMRVVVARVQLTPQEFEHPKLINPAPKPPDNGSRTSQAPASQVVASQAPDSLRPSLNASGLLRVAEADTSEGAVVSDAPMASAATPGIAGWHRIADQEEPVIVLSGAGATAIDTAAVAPAMSGPIAVPTEVVSAAGAASDTSEPATTSSTIAAPATEPERPTIDPAELSLPRPAPLRTRAAEPAKRTGQVSVFISGKEKRIFVRHAFVPLFDMPVEIANPAKPLGTHTFTALEAAAGGERMRWNLVSMPLTAAVAPPATKNGVTKNGATKQRRKNLRGAVVTSESSNATEALDRVTIPQEAVDRIAELLTPGSSLIISDEGLGRETGRYTEFIVETR
jgi:lipoprotein-anchoring transpeptidase ErfK/SrfK